MGESLEYQKDHPMNSALLITRHNTSYAELGIRVIFISDSNAACFPAPDSAMILE